MGALDSFTALQAAGAGIVFALNPKNLLLLVAGMTGIAQAGLSTGDEAVSLVVFTLIATLGVATPAVLYFALGDRARNRSSTGSRPGWRTTTR
jgi:membrane protein DedA with SNARE-associated domain